MGLSPTRKTMNTTKIIDDRLPVQSSELTTEWLKEQMDSWVDILVDVHDDIELDDDGLGLRIDSSLDISLLVEDEEPDTEVYINLSVHFHGKADLGVDIWHNLPPNHPAISVIVDFDYKVYESYLTRCFREIERVAMLPSDLEQFGYYD